MMRKNMGFASRKEGLYWLPPYWATRGHPHRANRWRRLAERLRRRKPANSLGPRILRLALLSELPSTSLGHYVQVPERFDKPIKIQCDVCGKSWEYRPEDIVLIPTRNFALT